LSVEVITEAESNKENEDEDVKNDALEKLLVGDGAWLKKDGKYLIINLTTVETEENIVIANRIKEYWEKIGVKTFLNIVSPVEIQSEVIVPRKYEVLLYGQILGNDPDSYVFWHSTQASENGLNLSNYKNKDLDKILEEARLSTDINIRKEKYFEFQKIIIDDLPAIFLYSPFYTYVQNKKIKSFDITSILMPRDRFSNISNWYIKTGKRIVW
jgi:peptide/nickel transport system substrate-binding protein